MTMDEKIISIPHPLPEFSEKFLQYVVNRVPILYKIEVQQINFEDFPVGGFISATFQYVGGKVMYPGGF
jgi:hypothetical protein